MAERSFETLHFLALYSFSSSSLKASLHSSRLPFDETSWRKFHLEAARVNGLRSKGRLTNQGKHPSSTGACIFQNEESYFHPPKGFEGHPVLLALCGAQCAHLFTLACSIELSCFSFCWHLKVCLCPFSDPDQGVSTMQGSSGHPGVGMWEAIRNLSTKSGKWGFIWKTEG